MKRLALLIALTLPGTALATDYAVVAAQSTLGFAATFQGETFNGRFDSWDAAIRYDPANLVDAKFDVTVTLASAATGDDDRDTTLPTASFFDVAKFPTAHYVTTGFRQEGGQVWADGALTLRGVTHPLRLAVTFKDAAGGATLDVAGTLKRLDFGVGSGEYADTSVIGAEVKVQAHVVLQAR